MDIKKYFRSSIGNKILMLLAVSVLPMLLILYLLVLPIVEENYLDSRKKELKSVVESAYSIMDIYNKKAQNGTVTLEEAKQQAIDDINKLRYSAKEYYFVYNLNGVVMALGSAPEKRGENRYDIEDNMGNKFVKEMINVCKKDGEGFVTYYYPKLGETKPSPKLSYVKQFDEWNCFIGSGLYVDDIEASINNFKEDISWPVLAAVIFAVLLGVFFSKKISAPLKRIADESNKIAAGNYSQTFDEKDIKRKDEVGQLAKALSTMVESITHKVFWYEQILDNIPLPISVTDKNMNWTFINRAVEELANVKRETVLGKHCSNWDSEICKTKNCGVQRLNEGFKDTYFEQYGKNIKIDTSYLKDAGNNIIGHIEVLQDITELKSMENYLTESTNKMVLVMDKFSDGDLNVSLNAEKDDDVGKLFKGFNKAVLNTRNLISRVYEAVQTAAGTSNEISASTEEMAAGAQEQSAQTNEVATAVEQMTKTIIETTRNATAAADNAKKAGEIADEGGKVVQRTVEGIKKIAEVVLKSSETVKQLGQNSDQIGEIIQVIDDIADQTNLLALNAAIEAARAGEQGRGFAVVADEVRKLAERTTKATKEIADMIKKIQKDTAEAVDSMNKGTEEVEKGKVLANRAGESLEQIIHATVKVVDDITQVATASEEQSSTAEQISKSIEAINNVTNETASGIQQVARSAENLNSLTDNLQNLVSRFKIEVNKQEPGYAIRQNGKLVEA
ncbi:MAG: methyl-accepting chemotaxis protein [Ignavibacteriaceae bacterium]